MNKRKTISSLKISIIIFCFIFVVCTVIAVSYKAILKNMYPIKYTEYIDKYSVEYNVPKDLLYAVIKTESGFDEKAKSNVGAIGLTQITPETFQWLQTKTGESLEDDSLYDPETSIRYCAVFYSLLLNEFDDVETSVAAYHAGRSKVNEWLHNEEYSRDGKTLEKIPSAATSHYVSKVVKAISVYNNLYKEEF